MLETARKADASVDASQTAESNFGRWMALTAALLGWMFDGFEMGLFPLIGGPALNDLLGPASAAQATQWFGAIIAVFLVGAATGGVFFGWLGDRIGRVRAMALSIFTYAMFTGLCGFATEAWHIAALRFVASLGMGGEWSLGVALVNEIWPNKSRALIAGLIGAAANLGFLMVGLLSIGLHRFIGARRSAVARHRHADGDGRSPARKLRMAVPDDQRRAAGAARVLHPSVRARIEEVGAREGARGDVALVERRPRRRLDRLSGIDRDHLELVAGRNGPGHRRHHHDCRRRRCALGIPLSCSTLSRARRLRGLVRPAAAAHGDSPHAAWRRPRRRRAARHVGIDSVGAALGISARARPCQVLEGIHPDLRRRSAPSSSPSLRASSREGSGAASPTPRSAWDRFCRACCSTRATIGSTRSSCSRSSWPAASPQGSTDGSPSICPSSSPRSCAPRDRGSAYNFGRILAAVGGLQTATLMGFFGGSFPMAGSVLTVFYAVGCVHRSGSGRRREGSRCLNRR